MRLQTPVTAENVKNHFTYGLWKYALLVVAAIFGWSLLFTVTAYHSPQDKRIDVYVQTATASTEVMDEFFAPIWKSTVPDMETVSSVVLMPGNDYTTEMQLFTYIMAAEGDIYLLSEENFKNLAGQEAFLPLEDLVEDGTLNVEDVDLTKGYVAVLNDAEEGQPATSTRRLYGVPLDSFYGFMEGMMLDNRGMYAVIAVNNQNDSNVIPFFNALLQAGRGGKPEWINETP